ASVIFHTEQGDPLEVFTTRPDTLWGATFMVLAPEHPLVEKLTTQDQQSQVKAYIEQTLRQSEIQREATDKEKSGVFTGGYAINPVNGKRIPIWIADYVLMTYGTGAIMAVPAHDQRDFDFAIKFGLPILPVIDRLDGLTKSFVHHSAVKKGFFEAVAPLGVNCEKDAEGWNFTFLVEKADEFIQVVKNYISPGYWVEIVGSKWLFVFDQEIIIWDSVETSQRILELCSQRNSEVKKYRTLMEMLWQRPFYRDALYHDGYGTMINSGEFSGTPGDQAKDKVIAWLQSRGIGKSLVNYRLRDWLISRQRYWGAPIPIIYCPEHGAVAVPEEELPVLLPDDVEWRPTGESPLKLHPTWKNTTCPICGQPAERETDTMDTFMCSSWYHLRYLSPHYDKGPFDPEEYDYWMPVDTYTGGIEHATMHLIYTRFFHKACRDMGITKGPEPMLQLRNQGIILGEDSEKMSKSRGNVVAPDELVARYGADTVRAYLMFFARWDMGGPWSSGGIEGTSRWIRRVWALYQNMPKPGNPTKETLRNLRRKVHQTLKQVTHDYESFEFNTVISGLMELLNEMIKAADNGAAGSKEWQEALEFFLLMMAPATPHIAEELWAVLGKPYSVHLQAWPVLDPQAIIEDVITLVIQVNGKVRDRIEVAANISEEDAKVVALKSEVIQKFLGGKTPQKIIVVPGKLVNIVI
ncbi:MAG: leucine--tRNA ligase, partial [Anaerolineaceae bacterium]